jgi:hypothetical protein
VPDRKRRRNEVELIRGGVEGARCEQRGATFTGTVWGDPLLPATGVVAITTVHFAPSART